MYLKSLEMQGFKSFPDKTVVQFGHDITAIVGPNGSGKSNISDAVSWVLGEQSSRSLRGAKMEDVIFGGTAKRAQVGFAEAALLLDNGDGSLRVDAPEVMITRRYYRSGESEYYINRQSARLRDIHELLMDTGLGREGYSNIGQGRIDEILAVKSTDRREIFEEAAGISKYRHRKEETERRLAGTEDNLLRIGDKIAELELQLEPLRRQAEQARMYLELRQALKEQETALWLAQLARLGEAACKARDDHAAAADQLQQAHDGLEGLYKTAEALGQELREQDQRTDGLRSSVDSLENTIHRYDSEQAVLETNQANRQETLEQIGRELAQQADRSGGLRSQMAERETQLAELRQRRSQCAEELEAMEETLYRWERQAQSAQDHLHQLQLEQTAVAARLDNCHREQETLEQSLTEQESRKSDLVRQTAEAEARLADAMEQRNQAQGQLEAARQAATETANAVAGHRLRADNRRTALETVQQKRAESGKVLDAAMARLRMLRELEQEYEGFSKAVRIVMQEAERGRLAHIHGPVSKLLQTEEAYTVAMETALGPAMQQIVVTAEEDGKAAIALLKRRDGGRATFLPLETIRGRRLQERGLEQCRGFVGVAVDLLTCDERYGEIFSNLLGKTVIVETMDNAIAMARAYGHRFRIVTLDGQVLHAGGSMTGGSTARNVGILSRANQLQRLENETAELRQEQEQLDRKLRQAQEAQCEADSQLAQSEAQLRAAEDQVLRLEGEVRQRQLVAENAAEQLEQRRREEAAADRGQAGTAQRRQELAEQLTELTQCREQLQQQIVDAETDQQKTAAQYAAVQEQHTALRLEAASLETGERTARDALEQLTALQDQLEDQRDAKLLLQQQQQQELQVFADQARTIVARREGVVQTLEQKREQLRQALSNRMQLEARKTRTEKAAQERNKEILLLERECARLEQKRTTAELEEKQIIDRLWDTYELTPTTAAAVAAPIQTDAETGREIQNLKRKLSALGTPNLGAIEEYDRVSERHAFLDGQRQDVLQARGELTDIIDSLTQEMTEIFVREFDRINAHFAETFREMFGGGKASLELEDAQDPLGCGIEIQVQPPGKQLKTLTLLSGGEKAFVAIALYFAILQVRPTPFCLLDEIDAALDDSNVHRFATYLRNLCRETQFIVITHRRGTMEAADVLYGVTMQEQGVSTILHIDMEQMTKELGI
ncbi:chromosome segregation protein SMC [Candidatus Avoscillospira sp. LCP25S3_F1]|uniref:chromosome segregation protein SMC n=1 Tax=Candidatus Avoscillospira sp. LCP25S3_F1 TaxID=3438825 RepID=UPI003F93C314